MCKVAASFAADSGADLSVAPGMVGLSVAAGAAALLVFAGAGGLTAIMSKLESGDMLS